MQLLIGLIIIYIGLRIYGIILSDYAAEISAYRRDGKW